MAHATLVLAFAGATRAGLLETAPSSSVTIIALATVLALKEIAHVRMDTAEMTAVFSHV